MASSFYLWISDKDDFCTSTNDGEVNLGSALTSSGTSSQLAFEGAHYIVGYVELDDIFLKILYKCSTGSELPLRMSRTLRSPLTSFGTSSQLAFEGAHCIVGHFKLLDDEVLLSILRMVSSWSYSPLPYSVVPSAVNDLWCVVPDLCA